MGHAVSQDAHIRSRCQFGAKCIHRGSVHDALFSHPGDVDWDLACRQAVERTAAFRTCHDQYVSAKLDGTVNADQDQALTGEIFVIENLGHGEISLRGGHCKYVSATHDGTLTADQDDVQASERFTMETFDSEKVSLRSFHGKYVSAKANGNLKADRDDVQAWELFTMETFGSQVGNPSPVSSLASSPRRQVSSPRSSLAASPRRQRQQHFPGWETFTFEAFDSHGTQGRFKIVHDELPVSETQARSSTELTRLCAGAFVEVVEVAEVPDGGRVRARIANPAGWISKCMADGSYQFVIKAVEKVAFRSFIGLYVSAKLDGTLKADREKPLTGEMFMLENLGPDEISLRSGLNKYVSAKQDGTLAADQDAVQVWEKFIIETLDSGKVSLRSFHGKYVSAKATGILTADQDDVQGWETFTMETVGSQGNQGRFKIVHDELPVSETQARSSTEVTRLCAGAFVEVVEVAEVPDEGRVRARIANPAGWISKCMADGSYQFVIKAVEMAAFRSFLGLYVSAKLDGTLSADRDQAHAGAIFMMENQGNGKISLRSDHGKYVSAKRDGTLNAVRNDVQVWEKFMMETLDSGKVSLRSFHGKYVSVKANGILKADRDDVQGWEMFTMETFGSQVGNPMSPSPISSLASSPRKQVSSPMSSLASSPRRRKQVSSPVSSLASDNNRPALARG